MKGEKKTPHQKFIDELQKQINPKLPDEDTDDDTDEITKALEAKFDELFGGADDD